MKKIFRKIHIYLGFFTLPLGLLFALTGVFIVCGLDGHSGETAETYIVSEIVTPGEEVEFVKSWALENGLELPELVLTKVRGVPAVGTSKYAVIINTKGDKTHLTTYKRNFYSLLVLLHKGKAAWFFNVLIVLYGISLFSFYLTGLYITAYHKTSQGKKVLRRGYIYAVIIGLVVTVWVGIISV